MVEAPPEVPESHLRLTLARGGHTPGWQVRGNGQGMVQGALGLVGATLTRSTDTKRSRTFVGAGAALGGAGRGSARTPAYAVGGCGTRRDLASSASVVCYLTNLEAMDTFNRAITKCRHEVVPPSYAGRL